MNTIHPSEKELQLYALDKSDCNPSILTHIESCADCIAEVSIYRLLFSEIKQQRKPEFDFDLSALVLSQLPRSQSSLSTDNIIVGFLVVFICFCIGIPAFMFRKIILNIFLDIPPFFIYPIIISTTLILIIKILSLYKKYLKQMRLLNFN
jgi:hypothetical protein